MQFVTTQQRLRSTALTLLEGTCQPPRVIGTTVKLPQAPSADNPLIIAVTPTSKIASDSGLPLKTASALEATSDLRLAIGNATLTATKAPSSNETISALTYKDHAGIAQYVISGTPEPGQTLLAIRTKDDGDGHDPEVDGQWQWQWQRSTNSIDWINIDGASTKAYIINRKDESKYFRVATTYTDSNPTKQTTYTLYSTPKLIFSLAEADENIDFNQVIYTARTADTTKVSYSLKDNNNDDASSFSINSSSGDVSLAENPDHENQSSYSFTIIATEALGTRLSRAFA